jgi:DNA-binding FrmR family transcriptional regulator
VLPEYKYDALIRLKTVRGHLNGILAMVEGEAYCPDIMKQVGAVQASLEKVNRTLLRNHLETCVSEAIVTGRGQEKIEELMEAVKFSAALTDLRFVELDGEPGPSGDRAPCPPPC